MDSDLDDPISALPTRGARGEARLRRARELATNVEATDPLRRRLLDALGQSPALPSELATAVDADRASVTRKLSQLAEDELVDWDEVEGDKRLKKYFLTHTGRIHLGRHKAFGKLESPPPAPSNDDLVALLYAGLDEAIRLRRERNELVEATHRMEAIADRAVQADAGELQLDAMNELATTCRQARLGKRSREVVAALESISLGQGPGERAELAVPAAAHWHYALGRSGEGSLARAGGRAEHLVSAAGLYAQLADAGSLGRGTSWRARQAWSVASLADNMRQRSDLEAALRQSTRALSLFEDLDDSYGRARCLFLLGFLLRLNDNLEYAWSFLDEAHHLAASNGYDRFLADSLTQMGEVRMRQGMTSYAREILAEAIERAEMLSLPVTLGFGYSALGAVEYQEHNFRAAQSAFKKAERLFSEPEHEEGLALVALRRAAAARRAFAEEAKRSFKEAARLVRSARAKHRHLSSPAGVVACEIEFGRLLAVRDGKAPETVALLQKRIEDPLQRHVICRDAWVPRIGAELAQSVGNQGLREDWLLLSREGSAILEHEARVEIEPAAEAIHLDLFADHKKLTCGLADDMGGETRRELLMVV